MAAIMGSDVTPNGLKFQFTDRIKPIGKKQQEMRSAGLDPKDIDLDSLYSAKSGGKSGRNISKYFGTDSTKGGIEFQFRTIKADAKRQKACYDAGGDPQALGIGSGPVKAGGSAIAGSYGEGVTGKAVSTYFERARKETHWDLTKTAAENGAGGSAKKTPAKRTPSKKKTAAVKGENGDDDESMPDTPSKSALNKVKGGRVTKTTTPRRNAAKPVNYEESEDDEVGLQGRAKVELMSDDDISSPTYGNGHGAVQNGHSGHGYSNGYNGNGNGYSNPYSNHTMANDNNGYDDDDGQGVYFAAVDEEV
ncbi:hypothetical protein ACEPPN_016678 [Leptodophora sp. 'Broadleaf-Isolate-01']